MADIGYTFGYYTELNPLRVNLAFLNTGLVCPQIHTACELEYGQGLSANLHAAASNTPWWGTDFNPSQAGFAQELAAVSGSGANLYDEAFADFANRPDLPEFDYIGIHLMTEHSEIIGAEGSGIVSRIDGAIDFAQKLLETNPLFSKANPLVQERIKKLANQNRHYLAHEYFNKDWHPMHFADMAESLEPARLHYACSAHYLDHIDGINLTADQQSFLKEIQDPLFRESVRGFMVNQQFRRDYWVKGARRLSPLDQAEALRNLRVMLIKHREDVSLKVKGALGEV